MERDKEWENSVLPWNLRGEKPTVSALSILVCYPGLLGVTQLTPNPLMYTPVMRAVLGYQPYNIQPLLDKRSTGPVSSVMEREVESEKPTKDKVEEEPSLDEDWLIVENSK